MKKENIEFIASTGEEKEILKKYFGIFMKHFDFDFKYGSAISVRPYLECLENLEAKTGGAKIGGMVSIYPSNNSRIENVGILPLLPGHELFHLNGGINGGLEIGLKSEKNEHYFFDINYTNPSEE